MNIPKPKRPKRAATYPGTIYDLKGEVLYYPDTGTLITNSRYHTKFYRSRQGYMMVYLPVPGENYKKYFRADHVAWALMDMAWPEGWIEPVNGLKTDLRMQNLVHVDQMGRRWWHMKDGTKVEVAEDTMRVADGDQIIVRPRLIDETLEADLDTDNPPKFGEEWGVMDEETEILDLEIAGAVEPDTEDEPVVPEVSKPDEDGDG